MGRSIALLLYSSALVHQSATLSTLLGYQPY